ncbi:MAG: class I SAM-dependent methyltransferase [Gammaproteobacteria bacterium]
MSFYGSQILPCLIHLAMQQSNLAAYRRRVIPSAERRVLDVGVGSGLNLLFYSDRADCVIGLGPWPGLLAKVIGATNLPVELLKGSAELVPLEDGSIHTVVRTWTLCTTPDAPRTLREMRWILELGGRLLFAEYGRAPEVNVQRWQDHLTSLWKRIGGDCHLNRAIADLIVIAGFRSNRLKRNSRWPGTSYSPATSRTRQNELIALSS